MHAQCTVTAYGDVVVWCTGGYKEDGEYVWYMGSSSLRSSCGSMVVMRFTLGIILGMEEDGIGCRMLRIY